MKVLMLNGGPHEHGCTDRALREAADALQQNRIDCEIFWVGNQPVGGCIACGGCRKNPGACALGGRVNQFIEKAREADGFIFGSPVHYAAAAGNATAFLDRAFYAGGAAFQYKPGAAVVSCRRGGASAAFDQLGKYMSISSMPLIGSQYWNMVHGNSPEEVEQDEEGLQTMRRLGENMAWILRCIASGRENGIFHPEGEAAIRTNFIR